MSDDPRPVEPRIIDAADPEKLREAAEVLKCRPELIAEAIEKVGPNRTAVELYLAAPRL
jgi:hypothetical protein